MLLNCGIGEDSWESLGLQGDPTVHPKGNQSLIFIGRTDAEAETNTLATWCEELTHWKRPWCWKRLKAGGEEADKGQDAWMASPTQCQQFWANPGRQWRTEEPGVLWSMGSQRVGHNLASEQQCDLTKALKFHPPVGTFSLSYWNEETCAWASPLVLEYGWKV